MNQRVTHELFARCASGFEGVLADELKALGAQRVRPLKGGVAFFGTTEDAYRACLWSRVATRIQLVLARVGAGDAAALYAGVCAISWEEHVAPGATMAVQAHGTNAFLRNTQFTALKVKDAVCDRLSKVRGSRPDVNAKNPDFSIDVSLHKDRATLYLNLSGASLHRRGYRTEGVQVEAPLKETLAAGMLLAAGWGTLVKASVPTGAQGAAAGKRASSAATAGVPADAGNARAESGGANAAQPVLADAEGARKAQEAAAPGFVDPMCGSGTLAVEAALIAADVAPGILRTRWGFQGWAQHDAPAWEALLDDAEERKRAGVQAAERGGSRILAGDLNARAVEIARANARAAGVEGLVEFRVADAAEAQSWGLPPAATGLLATNPPYGQRLLDSGQLPGVYAALAKAVDALPEGWGVAVITPDAAVDTAIGCPPDRVLACYNGPIEAMVRVYGSARAKRTVLHVVSLSGVERSVRVLEPNTEQFAARLRKVAKERAKWARKAGVSCYRVYDADLPDYACAIDVFMPAGESTAESTAESAGKAAGKAERGMPQDSSALVQQRPPAPDALPYVRVVEYQAPASVDPALADRRFADTIAVVPAVLDVPQDHVFTKVRKKAKGGGQYRDARGASRIVPVRESGYLLEVDLGGHLDTGLFLDHRTTRELLGRMAAGARFLNLFAYTGVATVHAAGGGAASTTTVDLSNTYLDWARRNMAANGFAGPRHSFVRADARAWLDDQAAQGATYDLVFCDPPTFSNSKAMDGSSFDVQRDHAALIVQAAHVLAPGGAIVFSCNLRSFKLDEAALARAGLAAEDITADTIPHDFSRTPKVHRCYLVRREGGA